ncbi:homoserine kinase [Edaphobacter dinghuensis]|uniref:Homoserine kinase n=1 Tax=Edaphobacter dinghuensis TaxID=1560005 RepID=A0A917HCA7_9BACT|nr:homoserine kinase [Edaphobacter dinghuensis]GGG74645.1 homoserine kinase [Edaphobacter dinghuensis]
MTPLHLRLPATSANLGPGFDALGLAMALYLTIDATEAKEFGIRATGRNADLCGDVANSLVFTTYKSVLAAHGRTAVPLHLELNNEIPLGMGCGSSAAALLAGVLLADHFGELGWSSQQILEEACRREGHPDNVAACFLGGMTASADDGSRIITATCGQDLKWKLLLALPSASLATEKARALLPATYSRADAVANVQNTALLVSAFALNRGDLLRAAMQDRIHQPYRMEACPLLPRLLPLNGTPGVLGVALSGAGPSVLVIAEEGAEERADVLKAAIRKAASDPELEIIETVIAAGTTVQR